MARTLGSVIVLAFVVVVCAWAMRGTGAVAETGPKPVEGGFALLELFTSEGCSSCPPADKLLGEVIADAQEHQRPIYALAYHIDYWDKLGWKDPFGSKMATERQQAYATALAADVYTPQLVVNGAEEFVGSDRDRLQKSIQAALARTATATVSLKAETGDKPGRVPVRYQVEGAPAGAVLQVAYVEDKLANEVKRGENAGRKLVHYHVVRALETVNLDQARNGTVTLDIPERRAGSVIGFVQAKGLKVLGASMASSAVENKE